MALVVFAGGASCAARWAIGAIEGRSALVNITGASTSCGMALARHLVSRMLAAEANTLTSRQRLFTNGDAVP
jgi:hypothetical protein